MSIKAFINYYLPESLISGVTAVIELLPTKATTELASSKKFYENLTFFFV